MVTYLILIMFVILLSLFTYVFIHLRKRGKSSKTVFVKPSYIEDLPVNRSEEKVISVEVSTSSTSKVSAPQIIGHVKPPEITASQNKNKPATNEKGNRKQESTLRTPSLREKEAIKNNLRKMAVIWRKPININSCYRCDQVLEFEVVYMATSPSLYSKGKNLKFIEANVLTCKTCQYVCADDNMILEMKHSIKGNYIDIRNWGLNETKPYKATKQEPASSSTPLNNDFKWPSTFAVETIKPISIVNEFETESGLHRLGYKISGISRQRRWWILEHEALPKLGLQQVANTIAAIVRARKRQRGGKQKYANAILEWEHDLVELKKEYYRRDFTWPHTD